MRAATPSTECVISPYYSLVTTNPPTDLFSNPPELLESFNLRYLWEDLSCPKEKTVFAPHRREKGKAEKCTWYVRKTGAQTSGCKVHLCCSGNFTWIPHYEAGLICLVNKLYMTCFYLACVLAAFLYNFWVHSGMLSLNIYDVPQLNFQRNPLWN